MPGSSSLPSRASAGAQRDARKAAYRDARRAAPFKSGRIKLFTRTACFLALLGGAAVYNFAFVDEAPQQGAAEGDMHRGGRRLDGGNYPPPVFTSEQRGNGAIILHCIGVIYMFIALAIVCDEYFVPALDVITERTGVSEDVAGATFMAAGGSMPELFTSFIGVFVAESNVGFGAIVGSAVFNVLFVIGMCAIFSTGELKLTWWPLARDSTIYSIVLLMLVIFFLDRAIEWFEVLLLFCMYIVYVTLMMNNAKLYKKAMKLLGRDIKAAGGGTVEHLTEEDLIHQQSGVPMTFVRPMTFRAGTLALMLRNLDAINRGPNPKRDKRFQRAGQIVLQNLMAKTIVDVGDKVSTSWGAGIVRRVRVANLVPYVVEMTGWKLANGKGAVAYMTGDCLGKKMPGVGADRGGAAAAVAAFGGGKAAAGTGAAERSSPSPIQSRDVDVKVVDAGEAAKEAEIMEDSAAGLDLSFPLRRPGESTNSFAQRVATYLMLAPLTFTLYYTVPNTQVAKWKEWYPVAFAMSILWIGAFSYLMVWWATVIGDQWGIPPEVMGLTFLAAGTSVPDLLTSVIVAKQGFGDMAVSSSIGSNIFDVTVGLPLPWFIFTLVKAAPVCVSSDGLFTSVVVLFIMLLVVIGSILASGWVMSRGLGYAMFALYAVFVAQNLLTEYGYLPAIGGGGVSGHPSCAA